jgi:hypothetical protein
LRRRTQPIVKAPEVVPDRVPIRDARLTWLDPTSERKRCGLVVLHRRYWLSPNIIASPSSKRCRPNSNSRSKLKS